MDAIHITDAWWRSIKNENPNYYEIINLGEIVFHLCGSRAKLWVEYNILEPEIPFNLASNIYMFTVCGDIIDIWLVVKIVNNQVVFHKWALGHEMIRVLTCTNYEIGFLNADKY